jgi:hypothetical protein
MKTHGASMSNMGHMMLEGFRASDGEPWFMPLGGTLDLPQLFQGPIPKDQLEDLQLWSALQAIARTKGTPHPLSVRPMIPDPPDRIIAYNAREWRTELTELTIEDIRGDLARIRSIGRQLQEQLREHPSNYRHLNGRAVMLAKLDGQDLPKDTRQLKSEIADALAEDKGFVGQDIGSGPDLSRGSYDVPQPFAVTVNQTSQKDPVIVSATSQTMLFRSEVVGALGLRVTEKDLPQNEIVVISCGLPDKQGYVCPFDHAIFLTLQRAVSEGVDILPNSRKHLRGGLIHLWDTAQIITWKESEGDDFPWDVSPSGACQE